MEQHSLAGEGHACVVFHSPPSHVAVACTLSSYVQRAEQVSPLKQKTKSVVAESKGLSMEHACVSSLPATAVQASTATSTSSSDLGRVTLILHTCSSRSSTAAAAADAAEQLLLTICTDRELKSRRVIQPSASKWQNSACLRPLQIALVLPYLCRCRGSQPNWDHKAKGMYEARCRIGFGGLVGCAFYAGSSWHLTGVWELCRENAYQCPTISEQNERQLKPAASAFLLIFRFECLPAARFGETAWQKPEGRPVRPTAIAARISTVKHEP